MIADIIDTGPMLNDDGTPFEVTLTGEKSPNLVLWLGLAAIAWLLYKK